jgi:RimJ/RimL family protein N-acetyltransferase
VTAGQLPTPDVELTITTPRLRLTPLVLADADDLFRVLDDVRLHRFTGGSPLTRSELEAQIARWQGRASPDGSQIWLNWIVRLAVTGAAVGYVQATITNGSAAIAYVIGTAHSGQGFATEASRAICGALREHFGAEELVAHVHPQHSASRAVARHVGLVPTGAFDADGEEIWKSASGAAGHGEPGV